MPKLTYLLINTENMGHATPMAVSGYSGKLYGYAEFEPAFEAHVFRVPEDGIRCPDGTTAKWDGDMDLDIAKGMHRRLQRWKVRAVLEDGEWTASDLRSALNGLSCAPAEVPEIPPFSSVVPPMEQLPPPGEVPVGSAKVINPDGTAVVLPIAPPVDLNLHPKTLEKMCKDAGIEVPEPKTKVRMRELLTEHFSKQAA